MVASTDKRPARGFPGDEGYDPGSDDFDEVEVGLGRKIEFDLGKPQTLVFNMADSYVGYVDTDTGEESDLSVMRFKTLAGEDVFCWSSYYLAQGLKGVPSGRKVRLTYVREEKVGKGNVKVFKIEVAKA